MNELHGRLQEVCAAIFAHKANARVVDLRQLTDGWETEVYAFGLEADAAPRENLILRMYPGHDAHDKSEREFTTLQQLYKTGYPVPRVIALNRDSEAMGKPFVIMELIDGQPLGAVLLQADESRQQKLLRQFCELFVQLHLIDWRPLVPDVARVEREHTLENWLADARNKAREACMPDFDPIVDWLEVRAAQIHTSRMSVLHRDFHPYNVLLREDGHAVVIDWGAAGLGDFRFDLAWALLLAYAHASPALRDQILAEYTRNAPYAVEHIAYFEVMACLRRLFDIAVSIQEGAAARGMRPEAVELMKQDAGPIASVHELLVDRTGIAIPLIENTLAEWSMEGSIQ